MHAQGLEPNDPVRIKTTEQLLQKLFDMGLINDKSSLLTAEKVTASAFCRRRLPVVRACPAACDRALRVALSSLGSCAFARVPEQVLVRIKMCETLREAVEFVEHGHVRVGPHVVTDPAFLVSRAMEDHVTWVDTSKIRRAVSRYNDKLDDYDLMQS